MTPLDTSPSLPPTFTAEEAADFLGVSLSTWRYWERIGLLPQCQFGYARNGPRPRLYTRDDLAALRANQLLRAEPYPDPNDHTCYHLPLPNRPGLFARIDATALPLVRGKRWMYSERGAEDGRPGVVIVNSRRAIPLARMVTGLTCRRWRITYANRDSLDCRRDNLIVSESQGSLPTSRKWSLRFKPETSPRPVRDDARDEHSQKLPESRRFRLFRREGCFKDDLSEWLAFRAA